MLGDVPRFLRTIRHLRASQLYWRGRYTLQRRFSALITSQSARRSGAIASLPPIRADFPTKIGALDSCRFADKLVAQLSEGMFEHLNVARELGRPPDWLLGPHDSDRLWIVTLHYHRWACELARLASSETPQSHEAGELFVQYLSDWIERCDISVPGARHLAWNAFATATRIGWWIRSVQRLGPAWWSSRGNFQRRLLSSLWRQADYLADNIEWDLRGNHLLRDAVGLAFVGRYFAGPRADRWLRKATQLAADQVREQVLDDGGHVERSPMYHLQVMEDLFDLSALIEDPTVCHEVETALCRMADFARWARHPDGGIPLLNDSALESHAADDVFDPSRTGHPQVDASRLCGARHFSDTGLAVWHGAPWTVFFDVGPLGPDYQPGHSHADNLTLECSYDGLRLFVDPGTFSYDRDERRAFDRSTVAHNTVCVDRTDSSEVWHIFRVGRRARPFDVDVRAEQNTLDASAAHDGYSHLQGGGVIHRRRIQVADSGPFVIVDRVEGQGRQRLEGGWLLEPGWAAVPSAGGWELRQGSRTLRVVLDSRAELRKTLECRPWHPQFGLELSTLRLNWQWDGDLPFEIKTIVEPGSTGSSGTGV
jgi:uncharacterized heparinase superfamily protein